MTPDSLSQHAVQDRMTAARDERMAQYTLWQILGIWASIALPMGLIHWVISPILIPRLNMVPGFLYFMMIALGQVWQGIVAYIPPVNE